MRALQHRQPLAVSGRGVQTLICSAVSGRHSRAQESQRAAPIHLNGSLPHHIGSSMQLGLNGSHAAATSVAAAVPPTLQFHYHTSWQQPILHASINGGEWRGVPMQQVVSGNGWWEAAGLRIDAAATLAAAASNSSMGNGVALGMPPLLEFVVTDGQDTWDKAASGSNYAIVAPGRWHLRAGHLASALAPAVLVCSDLDNTMIGDDEATAAFSAWWQEEAVPAGSRLVYNTGRALDLFERLLGEKGQVMVEPDMLISSIGTRIYVKEQGRWVEDEGYTATLGDGWQLEGVREACYRALAQVGKDAMHFRPPSEMSEHKVTCGVRLDVLDSVLGGIKRDLGEERVQHRVVVSGSGDWRFLDLVPREAGKLQALEYARCMLGFEPHQTVACGDSGNDIDMLEGHHRSIVVGNAHPVLLEWAEARQRSLAGDGQDGELLVASGHHAHGILEGLHSFGFR